MKKGFLLYIIILSKDYVQMTFELCTSGFRITALIPLFLINLVITASSTAQINRGEINGAYRLINERKDGFKICIMDGPMIRREIYPEFLYGGNGQRYLFVPGNEIWIDNSISADEYNYTVAHEMNERHLMAAFGYTYANAHDSSLQLERQMRIADLKSAQLHESELPNVSPYDCDSIKEIAELGGSIKLKNVYLQLYSRRNDISIWIVNGSVIRREIYPDFGLSGNDHAYFFIPANEIWIDAQISCEETEFSISFELKERNYLVSGEDYDHAYEKALKEESNERKQKYLETAKNIIRRVKETERNKGTGDEK
ncbi:MAG: hypothetical protein P4L27_01610 [Ignavibacteriaceae bacterium]|nr:hypothetical protein [Ignavibacteriaceae bacterium]